MTEVPTALRKPPVRRASQRSATDGDLVDRIFEFLADELGAVDPVRLEQLKAATRAEFAGEKVWINRRDQAKRDALVAEVLRRFDGRNASEIARALKVGRTTVWRILKQAGKD
jgi:DNA invertase Pin-like site-specific DNA recombinase